MGTTRLLASSRGSNSLDGTLEEVTEFKRLNQIPNDGRLVSVISCNHSRIRVPNHAPVLDANPREGVVNTLEVLDTLIQRFLSPIQAFPLTTERFKCTIVKLT